MHDGSLKSFATRELWCVALLVAVVAGAHKQKRTRDGVASASCLVC